MNPALRMAKSVRKLRPRCKSVERPIRRKAGRQHERSEIEGDPCGPEAGRENAGHNGSGDDDRRKRPVEKV